MRKGNGSIPPKQIGEQNFRLVEVIVKEFTTIPTKISSVQNEKKTEWQSCSLANLGSHGDGDCVGEDVDALKHLLANLGAELDVLGVVPPLSAGAVECGQRAGRAAGGAHGEAVHLGARVSTVSR